MLNTKPLPLTPPKRKGGRQSPCRKLQRLPMNRPITREDGYTGQVENPYEAGAVRNIATFYQDVVSGNCENPTVRRSVDSALTTILGRAAAVRRTRITMDELLRENKSLEVNLKGLNLNGAVQPQRTQRTQREAGGRTKECDHLAGADWLPPKFPSLCSLRSLWLSNCSF